MKVSMGKREYQTWAKGDFSFPLMTLRDKLIITLQDEKGNEILHTGLILKEEVPLKFYSMYNALLVLWYLLL